MFHLSLSRQISNIQKSYKPVVLVDAVTRTLVAALTTVTDAFGTKAPVASATVPTKSPLIACASSLVENGPSPERNRKSTGQEQSNVRNLCIGGVLDPHCR